MSVCVCAVWTHHQTHTLQGLISRILYYRSYIVSSYLLCKSKNVTTVHGKNVTTTKHSTFTLFTTDKGYAGVLLLSNALWDVNSVTRSQNTAKRSLQNAVRWASLSGGERQTGQQTSSSCAGITLHCMRVHTPSKQESKQSLLFAVRRAH